MTRELSTRRARTIRSAVLDALNPWMEYRGGPGTHGLYWRTYNRVLDEQNRRCLARSLARENRRNEHHRIEYVARADTR